LKVGFYFRYIIQKQNEKSNIAVLISGCNRMADNVSTAPQSLNASAPVPQSQNAPVLNCPPCYCVTPARTKDEIYIDTLEEICGKGNIGLYVCHSFLSCMLTLFFFPTNYCSSCTIMFFRILRMVSDFSFPVHVALTNPSFLSKSKLSLTALAADVCLSLYGLIKSPLFVSNTIFNIHCFLGLFRLLAYPHIWFSLINVGSRK
jgi:hypothetical protein